MATTSLKTIATAFFVLATAGSTVDGRAIDAKLLKEMADDYDPATYTARLNIEHIRGISPDAPFHAYGDVIELKMGKVTVNVGGKPVERDALLGRFEVQDNAKILNDKGQKVFPSIEINSNFGEGNRAYLMGCALTDSPACIGTDRLKFNRTMPGTFTVYAKDSELEAALLEFEDEAVEPAAAVTGFMNALTGVLDKFKTALPIAPKVEPDPKPDPEASTLAQFTALATAMTDGFTAMGTAMQTLATAQAKATSDLETRFAKLEADIDGTEAPGHKTRPKANGTADFNLKDVL